MTGEVIRWVAFCLVVGTMLTYLRNLYTQIVPLILIGVSVIFLIIMIDKLVIVVELIKELTSTFDSSTLGYLKIVMKVIGIAYVATMGINICNDIGEHTLASKIEIGTKLIIAVMSAKILLAIVTLIKNIVNTI